MQWDLALTVSQQHQLPGIDNLLSIYVASLLEKKKVFSAIMLYMKAKQHLEAAKLIFKVNAPVYVDSSVYALFCTVHFQVILWPILIVMPASCLSSK